MYEVIVVGLGAMGSASVYQLAKRGQRVLGVDRWRPPHAFGSSHGDTRVSRQAIGEGEAYVPLVLRSHEIWRDLEAQLHQTLFTPCGALILSPKEGAAVHHGKENFLARTIAAAQRYDIDHEVLDTQDIAKRFPQYLLAGDELGYFEPGAGYVHPELAIGGQLELAQTAGAELHYHERFLGFEERSDHLIVRSDRAEYRCEQLVLSAGAWIQGLLPEGYKNLFQIYRQVLYWYEVDKPQRFHESHSPVFMWMHGDSAEDYVYGFPVLEGERLLKVSTSSYQQSIDPEELDRNVHQEEIDAMFRRHLQGRLRGVRPHSPKTAACMYTNTLDSDFIIDRHPESSRVLLVSACSGHGFKHSAALGESVAQLILGEVREGAWGEFGLKRF